MIGDPSERRLEFWKRGLCLATGVSLTLFVLSYAESPNGHLSTHWGWYVLWFLALALTTPCGFLMLLGKSRLERKLRLNTAFGYFALTYLLILSFVIKTNQDQSFMYGGLVTLLLYFVLGGLGLALFSSYWFLRGAFDGAAEEMFP